MEENRCGQESPVDCPCASRFTVDAAAIGYCGLGRAVDALGLRSVGAIELDFVVSLCWLRRRSADGSKQLRSVDGC